MSDDLLGLPWCDDGNDGDGGDGSGDGAGDDREGGVANAVRLQGNCNITAHRHLPVTQCWPAPCPEFTVCHLLPSSMSLPCRHCRVLIQCAREGGQLVQGDTA